MKLYISKITIATACAFIFLSGCKEDAKENWHFSQVSLLDEKCDNLTSTDKNGLVWRPLIGRIMGSQSKSGLINHHGGPGVINHHTVIRSEAGDVKVGFAFTLNEREMILDHIYKTYEDEAMWDEDDTKKEYGLCVTTNNTNAKFGNFLTLTMIGD